MPDFTSEQTEAGVVAGLAAMASDVRMTTVEGVPFLAVPDGVALTNHADLLPAPKRLTAAPKFSEADSFSAYVNLFKQDSTILMAWRSSNTVKAFIDYHGKGEPSWNVHSAALQVVLHDDFVAWSGLGQGVSQTAFGEFIEDHMHNIAKPDGATLKDMVLKFAAMKETTFKSSVNLENGDVNLTYIEDSERNIQGAARFPSELALVLPVYDGHPPIDCKARIRYRIREGKLTFQVEIVRKTELVREAFNAVLNTVAMATEIDVMMGG